MRKTYMTLVALVLSVLGVTNVNAGEIISLQEVPFCSWDGWGAEAQSTGDAECLFILNEAASTVYGDDRVINYADLSLYSKLIVKTVEGTEGSPRFLFNRTVDEGQWNEDESQSNLIDNTKGGWSAKYFSQDGNTYTVDLKLMVKEKGFAHLHAIKSASWGTTVTLASMEVERQGKAQQVGWTDLITNGDMEGDDVSCFYSKENGGEPYPSVITDGIGVDGSRGIMVHSAAGASQDWDAQFWINLPECLAPNAKYRVSFDYKASTDATADTQAHRDPSDYIHYEMIGSPNFTTDWQTYKYEGEITEAQSGNGEMHSIAFNLSKDKSQDIDFFFDNIKFEVYKYGTTAEFYMDIMQVDFGFDTNVAELVAASGKPRILYPNECVKVTADGEVMAVMSVEGYADGRFYVFMEDALEDDAEVELSFTNPTDPALHLLYTSGPGGDISDFSVVASYNEEIGVEDAYPYLYVKPTVIAADPEDGSFNLPNSIKDFKITFDKNADCAKLVATLNGKKLSVSPAEGLATEVTFSRTEDADLATGEYTLKVDKIFAEQPLVDDDFGTYVITFNVGKVDYDPNDVVKDIMKDNFTETEAGWIPDGWTVVFDGSPRDHGVNLGSGSRIFKFGEGGDFIGGLYYRTNNDTPDNGYAMFGTEEGFNLPLEAGKKYNFHYNAASWKSVTFTKFELLNENDEVVFVRIDENKPNVNGSQAAVNGSTVVDFNFTPSTSGDYKMKFTPAANANGDLASGMIEPLLGNVYVKYMPNQVGVLETQLLNTALENAKSVRDANSDERYSGAAFDALVAAINKYEAEGPSYTAPSAYKNAAAALDAAAQAVKDHRSLCDTYDPLPQQAMEIVQNNAENKFANTDLYAELKAVAEKYATVDAEGFIEVKALKDDAELNAAIAELQTIVATTKLLFTEGESKTSDTGVKVLVERLRLGAVGLMELGVAEDDELVVACNNALTDDDNLAEAVKNRIKLELYGKLKEGANTLFEGSIDPITEEIVTPTYNMSVFVKNPNIYKQQNNMNFTEENVPGWYTPEGYSAPGLSVGWGQPQGNDQIAEDCMFQTWGGSYRVEQTINDLPAGVYTLKVGFGERMDEADAPDALTDTYFYVKTSATPEEEPGDTIFATRIGQSFPYADSTNGSLAIENVVVTDGMVTLGVNACNGSHTFFSDARIYIANAAAGFDYGKAYDEVLTAIDVTTLKPQQVRAIEIYDLNGRRIYKAQKGVNILRKLMDDGTIRTQKVVIK